jgi:hypothetical protein
MERCLSLDEPLNVIGAKPKTLSRQLHFLQIATPRHGVNCLNLETEHHRDIFRFEQLIFLLPLNHSATIKQRLLLSRQLSETGGGNDGTMPNLWRISDTRAAVLR